MKKKDFISLVFLIIGGLLFSIGMCMCLIPEWNAFNSGCIVTAIGIISLLILFIIRRKIDGKSNIKVNWKTVGIVTYSIFALLVFGTGMAMTIAFKGVMIQGIIVGIVGILLLICLIPMIKGIK